MTRGRLLCMVFSARRLMLAALLVVAAVIWVLINKPVEGEVLLELSRRHGVTTADLLSVVMLAMAVVIAWPSRRRERPAPFAAPRAPRPSADPQGAPAPYRGAPPWTRPAAPTRRS